MRVPAERWIPLLPAVLLAVATSACASTIERGYGGAHPAYYHYGDGHISPARDRLRLRSGDFYFRSTHDWLKPRLAPRSRGLHHKSRAGHRTPHRKSGLHDRNPIPRDWAPRKGRAPDGAWDRSKWKHKKWKHKKGDGGHRKGFRR